MSESWGFRRGDEIIPGCTVVTKLGGGRAYEAFEAFDDRLLTPVVIKIVRPGLADDSSTLRGLSREVEMLGRLNHPVIVRGFHAATGGDRPYVAMEFLPGPRLSTLIRKQGALPLEQVLPLGVELCTALHYMHASHVVHLDVKPSNIIMDATPRLIDLSIARTTERAADLDHVVGTDRYMAPEQCDPPRTGHPGAASDVWGLGATLYEAVCGQRAFPDPEVNDELPEDRWPQLEFAPNPMPSTVQSAVAEPIMAALNRDPEDRPTPREMMESLASVFEALPRPRIGMFRPKPR